MIDFKKFNSVISLTSYFTSDEKCKQAIIQQFVADGSRVITDELSAYNGLAAISVSWREICLFLSIMRMVIQIQHRYDLPSVSKM